MTEDLKDRLNRAMDHKDATNPSSIQLRRSLETGAMTSDEMLATARENLMSGVRLHRLLGLDFADTLRQWVEIEEARHPSLNSPVEPPEVGSNESSP